MLTAGVATVPPYGAVTVSLTAFLYAVLFICPTDFFFFFLLAFSKFGRAGVI